MFFENNFKKNKFYNDTILILDFGSQYTELIARKVREIGVYCKICELNISKEQLYSIKPSGIILSGSSESVNEINSLIIPNFIFDMNIPILGICYGMQIMIKQLGGNIQQGKKREFGFAKLKILCDSQLFSGINDYLDNFGIPILDVWMSHNDVVTCIPKNFVNVACTKNCKYAAVEDKNKKLYGVQFHPEVTHTKQGKLILKKFVIDICLCKISFIISNNIIEDIILKIKSQVCNDKVILGLSGGVDSLVTALLLHKAIGNNLICIFIDNGLLSSFEKNKIKFIIKKYSNINIIYLNEEKNFLESLKGVFDPEEKRKIIGYKFIEIFYKQSLIYKDIVWLAQGTIYPDIIESKYGNINNKNKFIKSHHNVGGITSNLKLKILEPLKKFFKDEVRQLAIKLGLPTTIINSYPYPGPGLSIRILGEVKKEYCDILRRSDEILIEELNKEKLYNKISQAFTIFLPIKSVGVMGDNRKYDWIIALRIVETMDFMTANWINLPKYVLDNISNRIINEIPNISRVVYDISSKPPSTIEWE